MKVESHLGDRVNDAPLIYATLVKSALFSVALACFQILEEVLIRFYRGRSFHHSIAEIGGGTGKGILSMTLIAFVALIPFFRICRIAKSSWRSKIGAALSEWQKAGAIRKHRGKILLCSPERLFLRIV